jgi:flagellar biosynthesis protein FlhF
MPSPEKLASLYVKSFFAPSVRAAMEQAQRELGADALLLNSRESPPEARHLGEYEVVFGTWPETVVPTLTVTAPVSRVEELHDRIHEIRELIGQMRPMVAPPHAANQPGVAQALIEAGLESELALNLERGIQRRMKSGAIDITRPHATPELQTATFAELSSRITVQPEIGRVSALVGPPGAGKTSTLIKLAVTRCLQQNRPLRLISADTLRIGGSEQLRTYANVLGVPFQAVEGGTALAQAIDATPANTWILIDTPGLSAALQQELGGDLAALLSRRQDIDTHLVLTASMDRAFLAKTAARFEKFKPGKLIFTRLDEASSTAAVFSEAVRSQKPLSFLCHGQSVPEDIQPASRERIVGALVSQLPDALQAVA